MKYNVPFFSDLVRRITDSWSATKTTDKVCKMNSETVEVEHPVLPKTKIKSINIPDGGYPWNHDDNYGSTY